MSWSHKIIPNAVILLAIGLAYAWLQIPALIPFSLQAFALATLVYFIIKRLRRAKLWHLVPTENTFEMAILSFAFLLLIGATGNAQSPVFFLGYAHLFFLTLATPALTAILVTAAVLFFHLSLAPTLSGAELQALFTLPLLLAFFLFAKHQYDEARLKKEIIKADEQELARLAAAENNLELFLKDFIKPKLQVLEEIATDPRFDQRTVASQLSMVQTEVAKLLDKINAQINQPTAETSPKPTTQSVDSKS